VLHSAKIIDRAGNANRWLKKRIGFVNDGEDRLKLNATGREEAQAALAQALDTSVADSWNPDKHTPQKRATKKKKP
jgi:hypothetical protein